MRGFEAIPELLHRAHTEVVFSMLGGTNVPWVAQGVVSGMFKLVKTRHEETSVNAAAGYARATTELGVCTVTRGPGFANSVNGLIAAQKCHIPVLMIVGESPATKQRTEQNIDQGGLSAAIGAGFHHVLGPGDLEGAFWNAVKAAHWNGCPQVLSIADGMLDAEIPLSDEPAPVVRPESAPDQDSINAAVDALAGAQRPLIIAGQGSVLAGCRPELEELAGLIGARVANTLRANRFFAGHPHDLGLCGSWSPAPALEAIQESDVVVAMGASLSYHTTAEGTAFQGATVIHNEINIDRPCLASSLELALIGDARQTAIALIEEWRRRGLAARAVQGSIPSLDKRRSAVLQLDLGNDPTRGLDLRDVYSRFDEILPEDRIVVTDSGRSLGTLPILVDARDTYSWLVGRAYGSVGHGLGIGIGAAVAYPDRPVVVFCGDGAFMMASHDVDAVRINDLSLTVVIMNDQAYGAEFKYLNRFGLPRDVVCQDLPDIPTLARAFGGVGMVVRDKEDLASLELPTRGLTLVDVRLDPEVSGS